MLAAPLARHQLRTLVTAAIMVVMLTVLGSLRWATQGDLQGVAASVDSIAEGGVVEGDVVEGDDELGGSGLDLPSLCLVAADPVTLAPPKLIGLSEPCAQASRRVGSRQQHLGRAPPAL